MNRIHRTAVAAAACVALAGVGLPGASAATTQAPTSPWSGQGASLTSTERLDGTFANPVTGTDTPDVSTIRVPAAQAGEDRDVFYMISTTMELAPGAPVLKSYDLVNWEIASYLWGVLEDTDSSSLRNGQNSYGQGQWASTLAFHDGRYYAIFNSNNNGRSYLFSTDDVEDGTWERHAYSTTFHDPSLYFEGDVPYVFHGANQTDVARLSSDLETVEARFPNVITRANFLNESGLTRDEFAPNGWEGFQLTKVGDWYYAMAIAFGRYGRQALVFRSRSLLGAAAPTPDPYAGKVAIGTKAIAQGGLVTTRDGIAPDYAMVFADDFPTGRVPVLVPVSWGQDATAWPTFGNGNVGGADQVTYPGALRMPVALDEHTRRLAMSKSLVTSDDFDNDADTRRWSYPTTPAQPQLPLGAPVGTDAVANGGFESATPAPWVARENATLTPTTTDKASGEAAVAVTGRTSTGSGIQQDLVVDPGSTYQVSFRVKVTEAEAAASTRFLASADFGAAGPTGQAQFVNLASGNADKTGFATITGTYRVPTDRPVSTFRLYVENAYSATGTPVNRPSYVLDDVSFVKTAGPGEVFTPAEDADNGSYLDKQWQWNHNPDNRYWSLTAREGWLRLTNGRTVTGRATARFNLTKFEEARNTLSQRAVAPTSSAEAKLDVSHMLDGDTAGLAVYNRQVSFLAVRMVDGVKTLGVVNRKTTGFAATDPIADGETFIAQAPLPSGTADVWLKADLDMRRSGATRNTVQFLYSLDGTTWQPLGGANPKLAGFEGNHFKGQRFGLFSYAGRSTGGYVDVDSYLLSDVLSSDRLPVDRTDLDWLLAEARSLSPADYPTAAWAPVARALADAEAVTAPSTQNQVDAPAQELNAAVAALPAPNTTPTPGPGTTPGGQPTTPAPTPSGPPAATVLPTSVRVTAPGRVRVGSSTRVQVRVVSTGARPHGRVVVTLRGAGTRPVRATLRRGAAVVVLRIPRTAAPGTRKISVAYLGDATHAASRSTRTMRVLR